MNTATVTQIRPVRTPRSTKASRPQHTRGHARRMQRQTHVAVATGGVALLLTALSLTHLSHGIQQLTGCDCWEGWAMAAVTDLGFVALEMAQLTAGHCADVRRWAPPAVAGMLVCSAGLNALAFGGAATGWMVYPAVAFGLAIPAFLYCLTRVGAAMYVDCHSRG